MKTDKGTISVRLVEETLALARARGFDALDAIRVGDTMTKVTIEPKK